MKVKAWAVRVVPVASIVFILLAAPIPALADVSIASWFLGCNDYQITFTGTNTGTGDGTVIYNLEQSGRILAGGAFFVSPGPFTHTASGTYTGGTPAPGSSVVISASKNWSGRNGSATGTVNCGSTGGTAWSAWWRTDVAQLDLGAVTGDPLLSGGWTHLYDAGDGCYDWWYNFPNDGSWYWVTSIGGHQGYVRGSAPDSLIGSQMLTGDVENAVKPFGAIDSPPQPVNAPGAAYLGQSCLLDDGTTQYATPSGGLLTQQQLLWADQIHQMNSAAAQNAGQLIGGDYTTADLGNGRYEWGYRWPNGGYLQMGYYQRNDNGTQTVCPTWTPPAQDLVQFQWEDSMPAPTCSNGCATYPGGYFYLDTTEYSDGVHTIQWTATDTGSNTDGIGSRFFTINAAQNCGD
jgi:hypothetical protein